MKGIEYTINEFAKIDTVAPPASEKSNKLRILADAMDQRGLLQQQLEDARVAYERQCKLVDDLEKDIFQQKTTGVHLPYPFIMQRVLDLDGVQSDGELVVGQFEVKPQVPTVAVNAPQALPASKPMRVYPNSASAKILALLNAEPDHIFTAKVVARRIGGGLTERQVYGVLSDLTTTGRAKRRQPRLYQALQIGDVPSVAVPKEAQRVSWSDQIVTMLNAAPNYAWTVEEVARRIGKGYTQDQAGKALSGLYKSNKIWRSRPGVYCALHGTFASAEADTALSEAD